MAAIAFSRAIGRVPHHVQGICDEFDIRIVPKHVYPAPGGA